MMQNPNQQSIGHSLVTVFPSSIYDLLIQELSEINMRVIYQDAVSGLKH